MKRKILGVIFLVVISAIVLCACESPTTYSLDENKLAKDLLSKVNFDSPLYQVKKSNLNELINTQNVSKAIMYLGNGIYADSIGIFSHESESDAKTTLEAVTKFMEDFQNSFKDYIPKEADKIQNAVLIQKGKYVVFCVSSDYEKAREIIEGAFSEVEEGTDENKDNNDKSKEPVALNNGQVSDEYPAIEAKGKLRFANGVAVSGGSGYELFSYVDSTAKQYADIINRASSKLKDTSNVYTMLIPLSSGVTLPNKFYKEINSSNQEEAIAETYKKIGNDTEKINIYSNLMKHRDEYIYFRTDHHWTALGAYYAYEKLCEAMDIIPITLDRHETVEFKDFLGSFYNDTGKDKEMGKKPDKIIAYKPISEDVKLKYTNSNGQEVAWDVIHDVSAYPSGVKYSTFAAGDNSFTTIKNGNLTDGSTCVVVKESFGNALIPFLVDHYENVYVIDYRYWTGDLVDFAKEKKADDVIFLNNISMIRNTYLTGKLGQIIG